MGLCDIPIWDCTNYINPLRSFVRLSVTFAEVTLWLWAHDTCGSHFPVQSWIQSHTCGNVLQTNVWLILTLAEVMIQWNVKTSSDICSSSVLIKCWIQSDILSTLKWIKLKGFCDFACHYFLIYVAHMKKYCDAKKCDLEILMDLHIFSLTEYENVVLACHLCVCMAVYSLVPNSWTDFIHIWYSRVYLS
jgi:hypothetical protein